MATKLNTNTSIVDYLKSQGEDSSYSARKKLATSMGISNYSGTASQNTTLLKALQSASENNKKTTKTTNAVSSAATKAAINTANKAKTTTTKKLSGVDDDTTKKATSTYTQSSKVTKADTTANKALSNLEELTSKEDIISDSVWNAINTEFVVPSAVTEADAYLKSQLETIQSGKTSYSDQVKEMMDKIQNREKFSYDVDTDPLFQQALASAMNSGKQAMQDTIGQASALTGGYGSTYATSAGNQAYNSFIEDAYDNLPQYYQMAMEAYQMEGDEMYRQLGMLSDADDKEYNRNVTAYDATYQHRNQMYNEAYTQYRDKKSDAFAMANLQLSEHGQRVSDAYNYYSASSDYANTLYEREYTQWADEVNQAMQYAQLLNSDYWSQTNFDEGVRRYEKTYAQEEDHFTRNQKFQASESQKNRDWQSSEAEKERAFTASENAKNRAVKSSGGGRGSDKYTLTDPEIKTINDLYTKNGGGEKGEQAVLDYLEQKGKMPANASEMTIVENAYKNTDVPVYYQDWTISDDTYNGGFLGTPWWAGDDHNDVYSNGSTTMTFDDLKKAINNSDLDDATKKKKIDALKKQSKN